ncbi:MAG: BLUF domain-containing protein [Methylococcus sp.]|jgi:hypothetical protein|nr:MAG: BLUF domain-containing protein [Methylococcus sp.]
MFHLVYVSSAIKPFSKTELVELLKEARENNECLDVTGMLLYRDGNFMQVLEGEETVVRDLYARIERDPRHEGSIILLEESLKRRQFGEWSMGFRDLNDKDVHALPGFSQFMNKALVADQFRYDPTGCLSLLNLFRDGK